MNCKKYRACLVCLVVVVLVCGLIFFAKQGKDVKAPADGTLVENGEEMDGSEDDTARFEDEAWA